MKIRFCMAVPGGWHVAEFRFYLDDDGQFCEAPATRRPIDTEYLGRDKAGSRFGQWRPSSKLYHCVPVPRFKERFPANAGDQNP